MLASGISEVQTGAVDDLAALLADVRACRLCADLPFGPRPVVQIGAAARIVIIGQAPGRIVHDSGVPWDDASGERLRAWTGLTPGDFYNADLVALMPMGFCYPGAADGADLPPRRECAPAWHDRLWAHLGQVSLVLLVGGHAQAAYAPGRMTMTERVRAGAAGRFWPLPHPSWRSTGWMRKQPWFEAEILPALRARVAAALLAG